MVTNGPNAVDRADLIHLLDSEIDYARSEAARGGWTSWASAAAALVACLYGLRVWSGGAIDLEQAAKWTLLLFMPVDIFVATAWQWARQKRSREGLSFVFTSEWSPMRAAAAWWFLRSFAMIGVVIVASEGVALIAVVLSVAYYFLISFGAAGLFVSSFWDLPQQEQLQFQGIAGWFWSVVGWLCAAYVASSFAASTNFVGAGSSASAIELAGALVIVAVLLFRVLYDLRRTPLEDRLVELRREVILGRTDVAIAARSAEVTLKGIDGTTVIEEYLLRRMSRIAEFTDSAAHARFASSEALSALDRAEKQFREDQDPGADLPDEVDQLLDRAKALLKRAIKRGARLSSGLTDFNKLLEVVKTHTPAALADLEGTTLQVIAGAPARPKVYSKLILVAFVK